jgi:hypothetical protein
MHQHPSPRPFEYEPWYHRNTSGPHGLLSGFGDSDPVVMLPASILLIAVRFQLPPGKEPRESIPGG